LGTIRNPELCLCGGGFDRSYLRRDSDGRLLSRQLLPTIGFAQIIALASS
jgi:hypothetical protein